MKNIAILGYGNIGQAAEQALSISTDLTLLRIYHHNEIDSLESDCREGKIDGVIICTPTREVQTYAERLLRTGVCTVDSFDIHGQIVSLRQALNTEAVSGQAVAVVAAGWDPGTDSVVRTLMKAMVPNGLTYTNFGPGRSMGHTVAAKAIKGVKNALSMTIPLGTGIHRRMVYIELEEGAQYEDVKQRLLQDDYFAHDETHVIAVDSVEALNNVAHGVKLTRNGVSGTTHNQRMTFSMTINNPALTGQVLVSTLRAALRLQQEKRYGAYTLIEIPPIYLLEGETEENIKQLV
ncbi:MAG: diaminopimelate dehydrogenase [Paludibacteraceae bacterium]|nr:diaminopimelate dehydrogenase [Paludibacteraceae bacterium]